MTALHASPAPANLRDTKSPLYLADASRPRKAIRRVQAIVPGLALALAIAAVATVVGQHVPLIGSAVPGAVIGAVIAIVVRPGARFAAGVKWASTFVLQCSHCRAHALPVTETGRNRLGRAGVHSLDCQRFRPGA